MVLNVRNTKKGGHVVEFNLNNRQVRKYTHPSRSTPLRLVKDITQVITAATRGYSNVKSVKLS